jgi:4-diphosphocytidyl-2-C-methyl-D-erythritol kinase
LSVRISTPAKINLWLEIIGKRDDGYHEVSSLMLPIAVYDHLQVERSAEGLSLACAHPEVPTDGSNLACRAAQLYLQTAGLTSGIHIQLDKNIPVGAGLGGGSADAAAVLLAMNQLFERRFSLLQLSQMAHMLGADVPFFLYLQPALATGIGEKIDHVGGVPEYPLVLVKPPLTVSTGWVYQRLKLTRGVSRIKIATFLAHPWQLHDFMENDLESVTLNEYPLLIKIKQWMMAQGALGALMSGSGPTVFGIFTETSQAERVGQLAKQVWDGCWVTATRTQTDPVATFG